MNRYLFSCNIFFLKICYTIICLCEIYLFFVVISSKIVIGCSSQSFLKSALFSSYLKINQICTSTKIQGPIKSLGYFAEVFSQKNSYEELEKGLCPIYDFPFCFLKLGYFTSKALVFFWDIQILAFWNLKFHDVIKCLTTKQEICFNE